MDPSSFASAAASLLGVTIQITGSLYGNWEYSSLVLAERLIYELSQLRNVLQSLEATALSVTDAVSPPPQDLLVCLEDVKTCLISLGSKLLRQDPHDVFSFQDSPLPWRSFNAPISSQGSRLPLSPAEATSDIQSLQSCISKLGNSITKSVFSPTEELLPKHIADPSGALWRHRAEYVEFHESARKARLDGTGRWFVATSKFQNWLTAERASNTLFCPGKPGSGKTILTSLAIDTVRKWQKDNRSPNIGLAYFYFSYKIPSPLLNVALALLEQLHLQSPSLDEEVGKLEALAAKGEHIPLSDIVSAVIAVSKKFQRVYIIIDALDECSPDYQKDLLYILTSIKNSPSRLLASSRPYQTFNIFNDSPTIEIIPSEKDIVLYAHFRLHTLPIPDNLRDTVIAALLRTREQHLMFLPVVLQLNAILSKRTAKKIMQELEEVPRSLYAVYHDLLERIRNQEPHMVKIAEKTLAWLYYSQRPLSTAEIIEVHRHATGEVEVDGPLVVRSCMGLVQSEPKIAFAHFSVKEFLEGTNVCHEEEVATHILSYLGNLKVGQVTGPETVDSLIQSNPLLSYAATYWGRHLRNVSHGSTDRQLFLRRTCLQVLKDEPKVSVLCHILFMSLPRSRDGAVSHGLVKSSRLHLIAYFGLDWIIDLPLATGYPVTERDEWGRTPLHIAAENGFDEIVRALLTQMSPNLHDADGRTAWHYAAMNGNPQTIHYLLTWSSKAPNSSRPSPETSLGPDKMGKGKSPLEYAAVNGNAEAFRKLFSLYTAEFGDSIKVKSLSANAMLAALAGGKIEIVEYLLSRDQVPSYKHLLAATKAGLEDIVQLLLEYGVEVNNPVEGGDSAIVTAAREARNNILQFLIWNGALLDGTGRDVHAALSLAVEASNVEGVRILLLAGAEPNGSVDGNDKLISYAARHGMMEIVQMLLQAGAEGGQAAFVAVETGNTLILELLLSSGVPADLKSEAGQSLLETARETDNAAIVQLLQEFDPDPSPRVVYSASSDNADMPTPPEESTTSDAYAALPDKSSQTHTPRQAEAARLPKPYSGIISTGTKPTKQPKSKSSKAEAPVIHVTEPVPLAPPPVRHNKPPTSESRRNASVSSPPTGSGVTRIPASANNPVPFLLLSEPIEMGTIGLGSIIVTPRDPLSGYAPQDLELLYQIIDNHWSVSIQHDFMSTSDRRSTSSFALEVLRPILNRESIKSRSMHIKAPRVRRERLHNHEQALERIYHNPRMRNSILEMMRGTDKKEERKELFLVVGLLIATDLRTMSQEAADSGSDAFAEAFEVSHDGDKIFAISCRSLKPRTRILPAFFNRKGSASMENGVSLEGYFSPRSHERLL
ncbi:hypothetical protein F4859DRAFT_523199 [Xylaria cf. heliscus]|nr:hypothetical protein F4859DRAFT_523199 [Xylaria cf. heliscus]